MHSASAPRNCKPPEDDPAEGAEEPARAIVLEAAPWGRDGHDGCRHTPATHDDSAGASYSHNF